MRPVAVLSLALAFAASATPADAVPVSAASASAGTTSPCAERFTPREHRTYARAVYERSKIRKVALRRLDHMRACAMPRKAKFAMLRRQRLESSARRMRAAVAAITPFPGPGGTHWAIPYAVVACEGGANGWGTFNTGGSGAAGPYQLLGHGAPMPAWSAAARLVHHRIARRLYLTRGLQPWVSSRGCWG